MNTKKEMDQVIEDLEKKGINQISHIANYKQIGLGDVVESTLKKFGVTEDKFKSWFNLKECDCKKRKKWLNKIFTWHYKNYKG
tara:strand:+ start:2800 stop:3048 length:249 start_codon:yes stop_codon:yes gene_type:complete